MLFPAALCHGLHAVGLDPGLALPEELVLLIRQQLHNELGPTTWNRCVFGLSLQSFEPSLRLSRGHLRGDFGGPVVFARAIPTSSGLVPAPGALLSPHSVYSLKRF